MTISSITGASNGVSAVVSLALSLVLVAGMQVFKSTLASSQLLTILGGYLASLVFLFLLTGISNLEMNLFGDAFQAKLTEGKKPPFNYIYEFMMD